MSDVSTQSAAQAQMCKIVEPIRKLVAGTTAMRKSREEYLPKEPLESAGSYDNRIRRSVLFNATGKTVDDLTGRVFTKPIQLEKDMPDQLKEWAENIDNAGRHLNVFACDAFHDALQPGIGYIYVDAPPTPAREDGAPATVADYQAAKWRPYWKYLRLEDLVGWKSETVNGAEVLTQIRIKECVSEQDPENPYLDKDVEQIRVITREAGSCSWETFRQVAGTDGKSSAWVSTGQKGTISLAEIPLVPIYLNRTDFMQALPPLLNLAELNIKHWQSSSDQTNIVHVARVPILFGAGFNSDDKIAIGANDMIRTNDANAKLTYVEHTGAAIKAGADELTTLEMQMQVMGLQLLIDKPGQSATGEIRDDAKETSPLAMMATALQDALEQAFMFTAQFAGIKVDEESDADEKDSGGSVIVNKDFGINGNAADLQFLTQLCLGGKLSKETMWSELQRRGTLGDSFDPDVEAGRIEAAAPDLSTGVPPGKGMPLDKPPPGKKAPVGAPAN